MSIDGGYRMKYAKSMVAIAIMAIMSLSAIAVVEGWSLRGVEGDRLNVWSNGEKGQGWAYKVNDAVITRYSLKQTGVHEVNGKPVYTVTKMVIDRSETPIVVTKTTHENQVGTYNVGKGTFKIMGQTWKVVDLRA